MGKHYIEVIALKNKIFKILSYLLVAVLASVLTLAVSFFTGGGSKLQQLQNFLVMYHVEDPDRQALEDAAAAGMVSAAGDRWSYYIPADQYQAYQNNKNNSYVGIGVTVQQRDNGYEILKVAEGGPAKEAGVQPGDVMVKVAGKTLAELPVSDWDDLIAGQEGTTVELTLLRQGEEVTLTVVRRTVQVAVATGQLLEGNVGYVKIANFNANCASETIALIEKLRGEGATCILFDVRNNGGGYAHEMIELLDYLLPEGVLFQTEDYKGQTSQDLSDANFLDMPMAVLVNGSSYSAAEFFAAALDEYDAAIVAGEQTSGKGHYQNTFELSDGSAVAISTGRYYTPKGVSLEGVGITPEVQVAVDAETAAKIAADILPYEEDPQIVAAINALKSAK